MLLPAKNEVARHLRRYRTWERVMLAAPADRTARDHFEDSGYTLCVLMGKRCAREAVAAAERYLQTNLLTYLQEQTGHPHEQPEYLPEKPGQARQARQSGQARQSAKARRSGQAEQDEQARAARAARAVRRGPPSGRRFTAGR
nr:DUF5133 domain-containing protein [Streptomyces adelaidensis]